MTWIHDFKAGSVIGVSLVPALRTVAGNGTGVDLRTGDGQGFAIIVTATISDGTHVITFEESKNDNTADESGAAEAYGAIAGVSHSIVAADDNKSFVVNFPRSKRFVRAVTTPSGVTTGGTYAVLVGSPKKISL